MKKSVSQEMLDRMENAVSYNTLRRGSHYRCKGEKVMVFVDGSLASWRAFDTALSALQSRDHLFIVTAFKKRDATNITAVLVNHMLYQAACKISRAAETKLLSRRPEIEYTTLVPGTEKPKEACAMLIREHQVARAYIGRHHPNHKINKRSFMNGF